MKSTRINVTEMVAPQPQRMTSLEIAELTGKRHKNLLKSIRAMEPAWEKTTGLKFELSEYTDPTGRILPCYSLTKTECLYIATKFNDEARARLVIRWEELEMQQRAQQKRWRVMNGETPRLLTSNAELLAESERIVGNQLEVLNHESTDCVTTTEIARVYGMRTDDLISYLRDMGVLMPRGSQRLTPEFMNRGLAELRHVLYYSLKGELKERRYLVWTQGGRDMITRLMKN